MEEDEPRMKPVEDADFLFVPEHLIGRTLGGRYRVDDVLATGGMGLVCVGTDGRTNRRVAIKLLKPHADTGGRGVRRFLREVRLAAQLRHPHIVDVLDLGTLTDGRAPYLVMELLSGCSLEAELGRRGTLTARETLELLLPILGALAQVHEAGVVHRDVKPANIFLHHDVYGRLVPKLLDFGIAKAPGSSTETSSNGLMGTPAYMAPEQVSNGAIGPATDVWAMGAVIYRCLAGAPPLSGATAAQTIAKIATETAPPLAVDGLHRGLGAAIDRALLRDPTHRYPDMPAFCTALVGSAHAAGIEVTPPSAISEMIAGGVGSDADRTRDVAIAEQTPLEVTVNGAKPEDPGRSGRQPRRSRQRSALYVGLLAVAALLVVSSARLRSSPALHESPVLDPAPARSPLLVRFVPKVASDSRARSAPGPAAGEAVRVRGPSRPRDRIVGPRSAASRTRGEGTPSRSAGAAESSPPAVAEPFDERTSGLPVAVEW
jgi:serine/threonine-protein kinase